MNKVGIAILCNSMTFPKWQADIIRDLQRQEYCDVRCFIIISPARPGDKRPRPNWSPIAWKVACAIEALLFYRKGIDATRDVDIQSEFEKTPKLLVTSRRETKFLEKRSWEHADTQCRAFDCDILIDFCPGELDEGILDIPRMSIWSYRHADDRVHKGMPPGFWEFYYDDPVTGVTLQSTDSTGDKTLARGFYQTNRYSWSRNAESLYVKGSHLLMDKLSQFSMLGDTSVIHEKFSNIYSGRCRTTPSALQCVIATAKAIYRSAKLLFEKLVFRDVWELILSKTDRTPLELCRFVRIKPHSGAFWADPFIVERQDGVYIFLEEYNFKSGKGDLAVVKLNGMNVMSRQTVMSLNYHLSFPFIFEFEGDLFMCPETHRNNTIELWKCQTFPNVWTKEKELFTDVSAADTVIFQHDGRWWLLTNIDRFERSDHCYELWAFYADHPIDGPWRPHARNPVIVDTRCARNAGKVKWYDGLGLVRFSQINERGYGNGIDIRLITRLDEKCYAEESMRTLRPLWDKRLVGLHHCDTGKKYIVFDVCRRRLRLFS